MIRGALTAGVVTVGLMASVASVVPSSTPSSAPPGSDAAGASSTFEIPPDRLAALEDAGLGWLSIGAPYPGQPAGVSWPTQDWPVGEPVGVDQSALNVAILTAFASGSGSGGIDAVLVVQGGRLVVEHYKADYDPARAHVSWSMAKSITGTMIGMLVDQGGLDPFAPAPVPEWAGADDPRGAIELDDLLHMRAGLEWNEEYAGTSDVIEMLFGTGKDDRAHYAADKPLATEPGSTWSYSTGTSMILARIIADQVGYGEAGTTWAQDHLFGPIGITSVEHALDASGVMSGGSNINMSAQDFARFGLLNLRGGNWDGTQIVPTSWIDYERMPFPDAIDYGAQWWVYGQADYLPTSFAAEGFGGQLVIVIPELDMVVVVLANVDDDTSDVAAASVIAAFAGARPTDAPAEPTASDAPLATAAATATTGGGG